MINGSRNGDLIDINDAQRIFEGDFALEKRISSDIYVNHQAFKGKVLELMSAGQSKGVQDVLAKAPDDRLFNDFNEFKFKMHQTNINRTREEVLVSPIALAVNVGDYAMLDALFLYLENI